MITSLTRRSFKNGRVKDDLEPWADATKKVAAEEHVPVLDLHAESLAAVQKMGPVEANTLAIAPPPPEVAASAASGNSADAPKNDAFDYTHLGEKGSAYFGRMVANELAKTVPELRPYIKSYIQP